MGTFDGKNGGKKYHVIVPLNENLEHAFLEIRQCLTKEIKMFGFLRKL